MKRQTRPLRRSGPVIMAQLVVLLGSLSLIMALAVLAGVLGFLCAMGVPFLGAVGVAKALGEPIPLSYGAIMALAVGCGVVRGLLRYLEQYSNHYIAFRLLAVLRDKIFGALRLLCPAKLETNQKGAIIAMITSDIETLEVFYAHTLSPICIAVVMSTLVVAWVSWISSPWLGLAALAGFLTVGIWVPLRSAARLKEPGVNYRREFGEFNGYFLDSIKGVRDIILHGAGSRRQQEVNARSVRLLEETRKMKEAIARSTGATELWVNFFVLLTLALGIYLTSQGQLTPGKMVMGVSAVVGAFGPVLAISALPGNLTQTFAAGDRVLNLLEEKPAVLPVTQGASADGRTLEVKDLSFSYQGEQPILRGIQMKARVGEIVGIVGPSGCGKSTLLKLLLRFWEQDQGEILYSGREIRTINTQSLLEQVTMVSQSTYLFDMTIEENLRLANPRATAGEMEQACRMASIHDFIMGLPQGYQTPVGALGQRLSAGEKQRIGLARAFLRGSRVILLDEPTSNLDSINEGIILKALKQQKHDRCIILVSHRESTMSAADRVYRMEKGRLYEEHPA